MRMIIPSDRGGSSTESCTQTQRWRCESIEARDNKNGGAWLQAAILGHALKLCRFEVGVKRISLDVKTKAQHERRDKRYDDALPLIRQLGISLASPCCPKVKFLSQRAEAARPSNMATERDVYNIIKQMGAEEEFVPTYDIKSLKVLFHFEKLLLIIKFIFARY